MKLFNLILFAGLLTGYSSYAQNYFPATGNVGIGTTSPKGLLHIKSLSGTDIVQITKSSSSPNLDIYSAYNGNDDIQTGSFGYGVRPSDAAWQIWERHTGADWRNLLTVIPSGNVGIGTTTPIARLTLAGGGNLNPNPGPETDYNGLSIAFKGENAAGSAFLGGIKMVQPNGTFIDAADMVLSTSYGTNSEKMRITAGGNVGIGTTNPRNKLDVNGTIHSKVVNIDLNGWNDYVFKKDYQLRSLSEVKAYIDQNQHLPEIPSEREMIKNGLDVSEMNKLQMKKIEELTLYLIEKDTEINEQKATNNKLQEQINQLNKKLELLINKIK